MVRNDAITYTACRKDTTYYIPSNNFRKLKRIIFAKQHQKSKEKLAVQESPPQLINVAILPCKIKHSPIAVTQQHQTGTKFYKKKQKSAQLVHIVEL